ncbi:putative HTH-type transcriptional regulator [Bacillus paralicheniformis]|uniref:HTH-type transcriptional regulator n=3 Tax=Bacillaceae TaxID=186817 RepID=A0ABY3FZ41_9BACI|nr:putative HTH-type transcriptional regulator [Bacillus paralicheniformis]GIN77442.1 Rrf2 family transcriptional regulator [Bacillus sp. J41TS8]TWL42234.1 putative HTH-type transcriptional regulator [Bacillus paralicheniformis]TWN88236.1 putative HTH-type transcriptional regulator [Bacillus paralicheniformis]TWO03212.1 putative HTH-type transcriptional regulator [Bacillus paralicheniformis]
MIEVKNCAMKYSKATNYALHTMLFLAAGAPNTFVGVQQLAERQEVSPTYLSKILTKLAKAGMIESASGANGGYRLKRNWEDISFLDIIHAIEGTASLFDCNLNHGSECMIQKVMVSAEEEMENYLRQQKISDLAKKITVEL